MAIKVNIAGPGSLTVEMEPEYAAITAYGNVPIE